MKRITLTLVSAMLAAGAHASPSQAMLEAFGATLAGAPQDAHIAVTLDGTPATVWDVTCGEAAAAQVPYVKTASDRAFLMWLSAQPGYLLTAAVAGNLKEGCAVKTPDALDVAFEGERPFHLAAVPATPAESATPQGFNSERMLRTWLKDRDANGDFGTRVTIAEDGDRIPTRGRMVGIACAKAAASQASYARTNDDRALLRWMGQQPGKLFIREDVSSREAIDEGCSEYVGDNLRVTYANWVALYTTAFTN